MNTQIALICFFLSGFSGLVFEIAWIRKASLAFGSTTFAVSTVLAVFFLGLAMGNYLFGNISRKTLRPLKIYAVLEVSLGLFALASLLLLDFTNSLYGIIYRSSADNAMLLFGARAVLVGIVLLPPTILMGGTLPLFCRQYVIDDTKISRMVGWLYGINTLGAAIGCVFAGFILLPEIGLIRSVQIGAAINILCGTAVWLLNVPDIHVQEKKNQKKQKPSKKDFNTVSMLFFFVGFAALGYEILWTRYLALLIRNTVYTYTLTLAIILAGIVLGSFIASLFFDKASNRAFYFGVFQVLTAFSVLILMRLDPAFWEKIENEFWIISLLLLAPAVFSGASFPLAIRMVVDTSIDASAGTGKMAAINTLGGILGSLLIGFLGLPFFGLQKCLLFLTFVSVAIGIFAWFRLSRAFSLKVRALAISAVLIIWLVIPVAQTVRIPADYLAYGKTLVDFHEGFGSNLSVIKKDEVLQLEIDRLWQGENRKNHQAVAAHVPMLLHPDPRKVLLVGVGAGQTPSRLLMYDVDKVACVDIEPTIFDFIRKHFDSAWMDDRRIALIREDGRSYIEHSDATYDVISLEVGQIFRPGVAFFYTQEFYESVYKRLNSGGIVSQFVPMPFFTKKQFQSTIQTFLSIFPQSILWYNTSELLLMGFKADHVTLNPNFIDQLSNNKKVRDDLTYSHWGGAAHRLSHPQAFLSGFIMGPDGLHQLVNGMPLYRDDRPVLDYETIDVEETHIADELAIRETIQANAEPLRSVVDLGLSFLDLSAVNRMQTENLKDIACGALLRQANALDLRNDYSRISELTLKALQWNADNVRANRMYGRLLMLRNNYQGARQYLQKALSLVPEDGVTQHDMGNCYHYLGQLDKAITHYRTAVRLLPLNPDLHNNLGTVLARSGNLYQAKHHFEEALRLRPGFELARDNLMQANSILKSSQ